MRVGFAGTPEFAVHALAAVRDAGHTIPLVLTQPDRPHGRGLQRAPSPVKAFALLHSLAVLQPPSLRGEDHRRPLLAIPLDVLVVAAYGLILPPEVLAWPRHGCVNVHASRLPRWRGAAPIARAIEAGDAATGVTIMQMDAGLDTGPMLEVVDVAIAPDDTSGTLEPRVAAAGAGALVDVLGRLSSGAALRATPQSAAGASYARKIAPGEAALDWRRPAALLARQVRAFDPAPGAYATLAGSVVKLAGAAVADAGMPALPGALSTSRGRLEVACGAEGRERLALREVKPAGGRWMSGTAYLAGRARGAALRFDAARLPD